MTDNQNKEATNKESYPSSSILEHKGYHSLAYINAEKYFGNSTAWEFRNALLNDLGLFNNPQIRKPSFSAFYFTSDLLDPHHSNLSDNLKSDAIKDIENLNLNDTFTSKTLFCASVYSDVDSLLDKKLPHNEATPLINNIIQDNLSLSKSQAIEKLTNKFNKTYDNIDKNTKDKKSYLKDKLESFKKELGENKNQPLLNEEIITKISKIFYDTKELALISKHKSLSYELDLGA
jgi:hypothetical protein